MRELRFGLPQGAVIAARPGPGRSAFTRQRTWILMSSQGPMVAPSASFVCLGLTMAISSPDVG